VYVIVTGKFHGEKQLGKPWRKVGIILTEIMKV